MTKNRTEAFSDGVLAVIITIMVLEMRAPRSADVNALRPLIPVFLSYVMSFVFLGIYSLTPFVANWMGETHFATWPAAVYGFVLLGAAVAYYILARALVIHHGSDSALAVALMWLIPDRRIEHVLVETRHES